MNACRTNAKFTPVRVTNFHMQCHLGHVKQMPFWTCLVCLVSVLVSVDLGDWLCAEPWCSPVTLCGVWREKKESDAHLGVRVKQVSLGLTQWRCN